MDGNTDTGLLGQVIGNRYRVLQCIGEGAMGSVYLAEDLQLHRRVALKVLRREWLQRAQVRKRLEHECRIMARLGPHPHIVTLFDRLEHEGNAVLVMEYVKGESLDKLLEARGEQLETDAEKRETRIFEGNQPQVVLDERTVLEITAQCLAALAFAHSKRVVHRDIKPGNVIISIDHTGQVEAKVMDFGIGKLVDDENEDPESEAHLTALTQEGGPGPGTPAYMAPEQIDPIRFGAIGPKTDLYSMGIMLFELLTCRLPFNGSYTELLHAHTNVEPPDPAAYSHTLSPMMLQVLQRSLQKAPSERYPSAEAFRADINALASGSRPDVRGTSFNWAQERQTSRRGSKPRRLVLAGLLGLGILLLGGSAFVLLGGNSEPSKSMAKEAPDTDGTSPGGPEMQDDQLKTDTEENPELEKAKREAREARTHAEQELARVKEDPLHSDEYQQGMDSLELADAASDRGEVDAALDAYKKASQYYMAAAQRAQERLKSKTQEELRDAEKAEQLAKHAFKEAGESAENNPNYSEGNSLLADGRSALNSGDYHTASESFRSAKTHFERARPAPVVQASQPEPEPEPEPAPAPKKTSVQTAQEEQARKEAEEKAKRIAAEEAKKEIEEQRRRANELMDQAQASREHAITRFEAAKSTTKANKHFLEAEKAQQEARDAAGRGDFSSAQALAEKAEQSYDKAKPPVGLIRDGGSIIIQ